MDLFIDVQSGLFSQLLVCNSAQKQQKKNKKKLSSFCQNWLASADPQKTLIVPIDCDTRVTLASKTDNDQSSDSWKNLLLHTINLKDFENSSKVNGDVCQNQDTLPLSQSWRVIQKVHSSCKNGLAMVWHLALFSPVKGPCHVMTFRDLLTRDKALKLLWV